MKLKRNKIYARYIGKGFNDLEYLLMVKRIANNNYLFRSHNKDIVYELYYNQLLEYETQKIIGNVIIFEGDSILTLLNTPFNMIKNDYNSVETLYKAISTYFDGANQLDEAYNQLNVFMQLLMFIPYRFQRNYGYLKMRKYLKKMKVVNI